jgi:hypothetical protein
MAYLSQNDPNLISDLMSRKEFYWLKKWKNTKPSITDNIIPRFILDDAITKSGHLRLLGHQLFGENYFNPNTEYKRLHLKWNTGAGKTIGGISIAMNFIKKYNIERDFGNVEIGTVYIIGPAERAFKMDLLRFPELGFITREERIKLDKLRRSANTGNVQDLEKYKELNTRIKKRFINRKNNGFFRFLGYRAFVNRLFITKPEFDINTMSEEQIMTALDEKNITLNEQLLLELKNSLLICDEIHNVYNSAEKNNWGIALQAALDNVESLRCVTMSATPLNNNPAEIIDLLNLLLPKDQRIERSDYFKNSKELKPNSLEKIAKLSRGRFSFLIDIDPKYYPRVENIGESIKSIPYLKFIRCKMSPFHYTTYKHVYNGALSQDSQYLVDFALPNPENDKIGIYQTGSVRKLIAVAPQKWKDKYRIDFVDGKIVGDFLLKENIGYYSAKYEAVLNEIMNDIKNSAGKIFIYHNVVIMSGVLFIEQLLQKNGFLDEHSSSSDNTICMRCGKTRKEHPKKGGGGDNNEISITEHITYTENGIIEQDISREQITKTVNGITISYVINNNSTGGSLKINDDIYISILHDDDTSYLGIINNEVFNIDFNIIKELIEHILGNKNIYFKIDNDSNSLKFIDKLKQIKFEECDIALENYTVLLKKVNDNYKYNHNIFDQVIYAKSDVPDVPDVSDVPDVPDVPDDPDKYIGGYQKRSNKISHDFTPARFIMAHSDIEKTQMDQSIDRYNSIENVDGSHFLILVGSKIIKESYEIKAVQNEYIVSRPDNIPTLIQIRGRSVRTGSHTGLPKENHVVRMKIFTSCLPIKDNNGYKLSYEEEKYKDKIASFQIIQQIEKVIHENAVDSFVNYDINTKQNNDPLGPLPYNINTKLRNEISLDKLNLSTFNVYYAKNEVNAIKVIIKRLFIELSGVWEYKDLLNAVINPPKKYDLEINTKLINESNFIIAINELTWNNSNKYVEPFIETSTNIVVGGHGNHKDYTPHESKDRHFANIYDYQNMPATLSETECKAEKITHGGKQHINHKPDINIDNSIIDHIYDNNDKIISIPGGQDNIIVPISNNNKQYYMLFPINKYNNIPDIDIELPYRIIKQEQKKTIDMNNFIRTKRIDFDYVEKRAIFYRKFADITIENMQNVVCEYGSNFHIKFIEECIEYIFNVWTNPTINKHEYHDFYFKMLYYYDLMSLVLWASTCKTKIASEYSKYAIPVKVKDIKLKVVNKYEKRAEELVDISPTDNSDLATSGVLNLLKTTFNRTSNTWIPAEFREYYNNIIQKSASLFEGKNKKLKMFVKASADVLPIGHFISKFPRLYIPEKGWDENPTYLQNEKEFKENNLVIGFDERSSTGVHIRFKIRNPIHNITKYVDSRFTEKGTVCKSKSKGYLHDAAKKLNITVPAKVNGPELCSLIKSKLIRMELIERTKGSNIKYFYFFYEQRPETR